MKNSKLKEVLSKMTLKQRGYILGIIEHFVHNRLDISCVHYDNTIDGYKISETVTICPSKIYIDDNPLISSSPVKIGYMHSIIYKKYEEYNKASKEDMNFVVELMGLK